MKKKENQRIALTKRLLKESLLDIMVNKNIQKITVTELCDAAQINRSTFYTHYGCPADVLKEIEIDIIKDLEDIWKREGKENKWPINKRVEALCQYLLEHKKAAKMLFRDSDTHCEFANLIFQSDHVRSIYDQVFSYTNNQYNKQLMYTFLTNGTYQMIRQWILEDIPKSPKEMGKLVYNIAHQGWNK